MHARTIGRAIGALLAAALLVAACTDDDESATASSEVAEATDPSPSETTDPSGPTSSEDAAVSTGDDESGSGEVIDVSVRAGEVGGGGRVPVELGSSVTIRVTSDTADHLHLHGYDLMVDVPAGQPAELTFDATIPGVFEVELEESGIALLEMEIS